MPTKERYVVIDIDGCISDDRWRMAQVDHSIANPDERYADYNSQCDQDFPLAENIRTLTAMVRSHKNVGLVFLTARPESCRKKTWDWLAQHVGALLGFSNGNHWLIMRPPGDHDHSPVLKPKLLQRWLNREFKTAEDIIVCVDDRHDVLAAYKEAGFPVQWMGILGEPCPLEEIEAQEAAVASDLDISSASWATIDDNPQILDHTVPGLLMRAAMTYKERNRVYGNNYQMVGPMVKVLFPDGVPPELITDDRWHLFELLLVKISRYAVQKFDHIDSIHDAMVYCAMIESLTCPFGPTPTEEEKGIG